MAPHVRPLLVGRMVGQYFLVGWECYLSESGLYGLLGPSVLGELVMQTMQKSKMQKSFTPYD